MAYAKMVMTAHVHGGYEQAVADAFVAHVCANPDALTSSRQIELQLPYSYAPKGSRGLFCLIYRGGKDWEYHGYPIGPDLMAQVSNRTRFQGTVTIEFGPEEPVT